MLGTALLMQALLILIVISSKEILFQPKKEHMVIVFSQLIYNKFIYIVPMLLSFYRFMIASVAGEGSSSPIEQVCEGTCYRFEWF